MKQKFFERNETPKNRIEILLNSYTIFFSAISTIFNNIFFLSRFSIENWKNGEKWTVDKIGKKKKNHSLLNLKACKLT